MNRATKKSQTDDIIKSLKNDLLKIKQEANAIISDIQGIHDAREVQKIRHQFKHD